MRFLGVLLCAFSLAALAADEPEVVYGKFHRAIASNDLNELMKYAPAARRKELAAMSAAQKEAELKMLSSLLPPAFTLMNKTVAQNGRTARLIVTGPSRPKAGRPQPLYGDVKMVSENGEWKVEELNWTTDKPTAAATPAKPAAAAQKPAAPKPGQKPAAAPPTFVVSEPPVRKLGEAKEPCVYKPVMTNEDLARCR